MSFVMLEFECAECGRFESLEPRAEVPDAAPCPECGASSPWVISAPKPKTTQYGAVEQGRGDAPPPNALDTRAIADGQPQHEFLAKRRAARREQRLMKLPRNVRRAVEKGE